MFDGRAAGAERTCDESCLYNHGPIVERGEAFTTDISNVAHRSPAAAAGAPRSGSGSGTAYRIRCRLCCAIVYIVDVNDRFAIDRE